MRALKMKCKGNCTLVEKPSAEISESKIDKNTGATMTVEEVQAELKTANNSISTQKSEMDTLKTEVQTQKEQNEILAKGIVDLNLKGIAALEKRLSMLKTKL